jgi:hypothetical protein
LGVPRSSYYYAPHNGPQDARLLEPIEGMLMRWPFYGYRRVTAQLQREGWVIGETHVQRLLQQRDHSRQVGRVRLTTTDSQHTWPRYPNLLKGQTVTRAQQVWVAEIV